jgi:hypothetical protein
MATYKIIRFFQDKQTKRTVATGYTLEQAQAHCSDKNTSSATGTSPAARRITKAHGAWFDGYTAE